MICAFDITARFEVRRRDSLSDPGGKNAGGRARWRVVNRPDGWTPIAPTSQSTCAKARRRAADNRRRSRNSSMSSAEPRRDGGCEYEASDPEDLGPAGDYYPGYVRGNRL